MVTSELARLVSVPTADDDLDAMLRTIHALVAEVRQLRQLKAQLEADGAGPAGPDGDGAETNGASDH